MGQCLHRHIVLMATIIRDALWFQTISSEMLSLLALRDRLSRRNIEIFPGYAGTKLEKLKLIQR